jgi:hypothetical protein
MCTDTFHRIVCSSDQGRILSEGERVCRYCVAVICLFIVLFLRHVAMLDIPPLPLGFVSVTMLLCRSRNLRLCSMSSKPHLSLYRTPYDHQSRVHEFVRLLHSHLESEGAEEDSRKEGVVTAENATKCLSVPVYSRVVGIWLTYLKTP